MDAAQDPGAKPMDSQPESTTIVKPGDTSQPDTDSVGERGLVLSREDFLDIMRDFHDKTVKGVDGFRLEDLDYIVTSATAPRSRQPADGGALFPEDPERQAIIKKFFNRVASARQLGKREISIERSRLLRSAQTWARLQITNMSELREMAATLDADDKTPEVFETIEYDHTAWKLQFQICKSSAYNLLKIVARSNPR